MRLFIAIPLPPDVRQALGGIQEQLRQYADGGRYVPADAFHITLYFIGESDALHTAAAACDEAVRGIRPFVLRLSHYGSFQRGEKRTGYIALNGELAELNRLHESLLAALAEQGFSISSSHKRFTPHVTLARDVLHAGAVPAGMRDACSGLGGGGAFTTNQIILYESRREQGRMVYTPLHRARL